MLLLLCGSSVSAVLYTPQQPNMTTSPHQSPFQTLQWRPAWLQDILCSLWLSLLLKRASLSWKWGVIPYRLLSYSQLCFFIMFHTLMILVRVGSRNPKLEPVNVNSVSSTPHGTRNVKNDVNQWLHKLGDYRCDFSQPKCEEELNAIRFTDWLGWCVIQVKIRPVNLFCWGNFLL